MPACKNQVTSGDLCTYHPAYPIVTQTEIKYTEDPTGYFQQSVCPRLITIQHQEAYVSEEFKLPGTRFGVKLDPFPLKVVRT